MVLRVDASRRLWLCAAPSSSRKPNIARREKSPNKRQTPGSTSWNPRSYRNPRSCLHSAASIRSKFYLFSRRGSPQRSAGIWISYFSSGEAPTFMDCIMQFKKGMQQWSVSAMNTSPIFSKLFHLQLAAIHTQARGQEKHCCGFMLLQPAFLLPVNLKISQSWLVLERGSTGGLVLPLLLCFWDSPSTANCNCPGHVSSAVSFRVCPHCCQTLDCYGLPYFPLLILPQNLRRRFHSEAARLSPALTLAAASCNGSLSGTGRSFSAAAIRVCSRWQLPRQGRTQQVWLPALSPWRSATW